MKKYIRGIIMAVFALVAILPQQVYAEDTGKVLLEKNEAQTAAVVKVQIPNAEQERISSLQLKLLVKDAAGNPAGEEILGRIESLAITFDGGVSGKAKILEQIYHGDTGSLNIYISGTEPLFSGQDKNLLTVGCVSAVILGEEHGAASGAVVYFGIPQGQRSGDGDGSPLLSGRRWADEDEAAAL